MTLPNFLIIGAMRAGTTSLHQYLAQHPQIYMSRIKEPNFFALEGEAPEALVYDGPFGKTELANFSITSLADYEALFEDATSETAIGEASTLYLYSPRAVERIRHYVPAMKLIAILRNPVERAYSHFFANVMRGREPLTDFAEALRAEEERNLSNWGPRCHYKQRSFYYAQLRRYLDVFDESQLKAYLYDDLVADPVGLVRSVFGFLGVDPTFAADVSLRHNKSGLPKSTRLHRFLTRRNPVKSAFGRLLPNMRKRASMRHTISTRLIGTNLAKPPIPPEVSRQLIDTFREDVLKVQDLIGRDLSAWLEVPHSRRLSVPRPS